jgi:hypothetical protein
MERNSTSHAGKLKDRMPAINFFAHKAFRLADASV